MWLNRDAYIVEDNVVFWNFSVLNMRAGEANWQLHSVYTLILYTVLLFGVFTWQRVSNTIKFKLFLNIYSTALRLLIHRNNAGSAPQNSTKFFHKCTFISRHKIKFAFFCSYNIFKRIDFMVPVLLKLLFNSILTLTLTKILVKIWGSCFRF
jgi:hypothetical protein